MSNRARGRVLYSRSSGGRSATYIKHTSRIVFSSSGVAQWLACWAHNPKVRGSKPRSAIICSFRTESVARSAYGLRSQALSLRILARLVCDVIAYERRTVFYNSGVAHRLGMGGHNPKVHGSSEPMSTTTGLSRGQVFVFQGRARECGAHRAFTRSWLQAAKLRGGCLLES